MNKFLLVSLLSMTVCIMNKSDEKSESYLFRKTSPKQEKLSFITEYKHHDLSSRLCIHNFILKDNQILHITSEHELVFNYDRDSNRIDITVKVRKDLK